MSFWEHHLWGLTKFPLQLVREAIFSEALSIIICKAVELELERAFGDETEVPERAIDTKNCKKAALLLFKRCLPPDFSRSLSQR